MQNLTPNRKRSAPGASPMLQQGAMQQQAYQYQQLPDNADYSNFDFSNAISNNTTYSDPSAYDVNQFQYNLNNNTQSPALVDNQLIPSAPSTELVRRSRNQQLAPQLNGQQEQWNGQADSSGQMDEESEQDLDVKVALAKKDALGKRKQIPPFVQKLSSFLDSNNTELIRWSDDGRSFIVLDEDEFARTLIPELFKHNNYASFVRQLNMYGFHKTVNITDGSLRQSEKARKGVKPPSMYSHPYFRKNRPDLLWLIQKPPGTKPSAKRKREGNIKDQYDSDDERHYSPGPDGKPQELSAPLGTGQDLAQLPRNELANVRRELQNLQSQQRCISQMITHLKEQNDQFMSKAITFQALHDRHENSINAILTFLATFYNRSMDGHHGAQNLMNMFANAAQNQQHGSVVEEYPDTATVPDNQVQRYIKRPPLLLPGPQNANNQPKSQAGNATTAPNSTRTSISPPRASAVGRSGPSDAKLSQSRTTDSPRIKDDAPTPDMLNQVPESGSTNDQMMDIINNVNATTQASTPNSAATPIDFNSFLNQNNPLTPQQRNDMVSNLVGQGGSDGKSFDALASQGQGQPFDMSKLQQTQYTLGQLQQLQKEQDAKVQELNRRLQPLSPTGAIPGLPDTSDVDPFNSLDMGGPGDFDPNAYIDFGADGWNGDEDDGDGDFDFGFDTSNGDGNGNWSNYEKTAGEGNANMLNTGDKKLTPLHDDSNGRVESVHSGSEVTTPANTAAEEPGTPSKRPRRE